jgi:hypothetical protein
MPTTPELPEQSIQYRSEICRTVQPNNSRQKGRTIGLGA